MADKSSRAVPGREGLAPRSLRGRPNEPAHTFFCGCISVGQQHKARRSRCGKACVEVPSIKGTCDAPSFAPVSPAAVSCHTCTVAPSKRQIYVSPLGFQVCFSSSSPAFRTCCSVQNKRRTFDDLAGLTLFGLAAVCQGSLGSAPLLWIERRHAVGPHRRPKKAKTINQLWGSAQLRHQVKWKEELIIPL